MGSVRTTGTTASTVYGIQHRDSDQSVWFAWTNSAAMHWMVSVAAMVPSGFGILLIYLSIVNYLLDCYTIFAASVLAAMSILRYLFRAAFPLFTAYMYRALRDPLGFVGPGIHFSGLPTAAILLPSVRSFSSETLSLCCKGANTFSTAAIDRDDIKRPRTRWAPRALRTC